MQDHAIDERFEELPSFMTLITLTPEQFDYVGEMYRQILQLLPPGIFRRTSIWLFQVSSRRTPGD